MSMEDSDDEWLFSSITTFDCLHMFQLEQPCKAMEWIGNSGLVVACESSGNKHQILELKIPGRLKQGHKEGLCRDRDFKTLSGALHTEPFDDVIHLPDSRRVVSSHASGSLVLWDLGTTDEDCDVIEQKSSVLVAHDKRKLDAPAMCVMQSDKLIVGQTVSQLSCVNVEEAGLSSNPLSLSAGVGSEATISRILPVSDTTVVACTTSGNLHTIDTRSPSSDSQVFKSTSKGGSSYWTVGLQSDGGNSLCARLSSGGKLEAFDLRDDSKVMLDIQLPVMKTLSGVVEHVRIEFSPTELDLLSVSGLSPTVDIYSVNGLQTKSDSFSSFFSYDGHLRVDPSDQLSVVTHSWSREIENLILSAGATGSLHAWKWSDMGKEGVGGGEG